MASTSISIAQAQAAADAVSPGQGKIVPFGLPISIMDNLGRSFAVDYWLRAKSHSLTIDNDTRRKPGC